MPTSNELRVFISSTFRDLQEEREHLVKKIFPEIRSLCRERGVRLTEVDLRWGITEEEAEQSGVIRVCLEEIDRCRPYFIGILGERYGWTPPPAIAEAHAREFPAVADVVDGDRSITEMEIIHGVLANPDMAQHAFFYFRDPASTPPEFVDTDPEHRARLSALKDRIRASTFPLLENFGSPVELGEAIERDLHALIDAEFPASEAPTELELQRRAHRAFARSRTRSYVADQEHRDAFDAWVASGSTPLVITGASGLGKSALVADLIESYRTDHPTAFIIEHYVGAASSGGSAVAVMRHIVEEICERFSIDEEIPVKGEELEKNFPNWLFRAEHLAREAGIVMLVAIDAVNQLGEAGRRMTWLPKMIPSGINLIVTTTPEEPAERLEAREWERLRVMPLAVESMRRRIVETYLGTYRKALTSTQLHRLIGDKKADSPLCLRVVAEELRLHGEHETIDSMIDRYTSSNDLLDVFDQVLARMETDYGVVQVTDLLRLIGASRNGLSESELLELIGTSRLELSRLLFAFDYHLLRRDGLLGFFHNYLRQAVERRYLGDEQTRHQTHLRLAEHFERSDLNQRSASERIWAYSESGEEDKLVTTLADLAVLRVLDTGTDINEVLTQWSRLRDAGHDPEALYLRSIERSGGGDSVDLLKSWSTAATILERLGIWSGAIDINRRILKEATSRGFVSEGARAEISLGRLLKSRGENDEALEHLEHALGIYEVSGDRRGLASAIGSIGMVYSRRGEYDRAMECFLRELSIAEELGDRRDISQATGNIGNVYNIRSEYDRALECYQKELAIAEELGDHQRVSITIGNMGNVYMRRGEYDRAMECFRRGMSIDEKLGDRYGVSIALGNIGNVYSNRGENDRAMEYFERWLSIAEELNDRQGASVAIGNIGSVHVIRGEDVQALECFRRKLSIVEELGDRQGIAHAIGNMGNVYSDRGEYDRALECFVQASEIGRDIGDRFFLGHSLVNVASVLFKLARKGGQAPEFLLNYLRDSLAALPEVTWQSASIQRARDIAVESLAIATEIASPDTLFNGIILMARIETTEGTPELARKRLIELLEESADDEEEQAEVHYWLWKLELDLEGDHRAEAERLYISLQSTMPKHEFKQHLDELQASTR